MKNKSKIVTTLLFAASCAFVSCNDWTDVESLDIKQPGIEEQNPELYTKYLENLRQYKSSEHKIAYVQFDNTRKGYQSRADHLTDLPDSIDIVSIVSPELTSDEAKEMNQIRNDKGTKVIYTIKYTDLEAAYIAKYPGTDEDSENSIAISEEGDDISDSQFLSFMNDYMDKTLALCDQYGYDGINICYSPKNAAHMEGQKQLIEQNRQNTFMKKISDWRNNHMNAMLLFEGNLVFLKDKTILKGCNYFIADASDVITVEGLTSAVRMMIIEDIPTDRFIVCVPTYSLDSNDLETGYFINAQGSSVSAIQATAYWALTPEKGLGKAGIGVYHVKNDYYNPAFIYPNVRIAINIMNPSPNNANQ